jgi:hypothetical protein
LRLCRAGMRMLVWRLHPLRTLSSCLFFNSDKGLRSVGPYARG